MKTKFKKTSFFIFYLFNIILMLAQAGFMVFIANNGDNTPVIMEYSAIILIILINLVLGIFNSGLFRKSVMILAIIIFLWALTEIGLDIAFIIKHNTIRGIDFMLFFLFLAESVSLFFLGKDGIYYSQPD